jgi:hypothetical protein
MLRFFVRPPFTGRARVSHSVLRISNKRGPKLSSQRFRKLSQCPTHSVSNVRQIRNRQIYS